MRRQDDIVKTRKHPRSLYLALTVMCKELIVRDDFNNSFNTNSFAVMEVEDSLERYRSSNIASLFQSYDANYLKYLVLNLREKRKSYLKGGQKSINYVCGCSKQTA